MVKWVTCSPATPLIWVQTHVRQILSDRNQDCIGSLVSLSPIPSTILKGPWETLITSLFLALIKISGSFVEHMILKVWRQVLLKLVLLYPRTKSGKLRIHYGHSAAAIEISFQHNSKNILRSPFKFGMWVDRG